MTRRNPSYTNPAELSPPQTKRYAELLELSRNLSYRNEPSYLDGLRRRAIRECPDPKGA